MRPQDRHKNLVLPQVGVSDQRDQEFRIGGGKLLENDSRFEPLILGSCAVAKDRRHRFQERLADRSQGVEPPLQMERVFVEHQRAGNVAGQHLPAGILGIEHGQRTGSPKFMLAIRRRVARYGPEPVQEICPPGTKPLAEYSQLIRFRTKQPLEEIIVVSLLIREESETSMESVFCRTIRVAGDPVKREPGSTEISVDLLDHLGQLAGVGDQ